MSKYNFDEIINRYNTNSLKYDYKKRRGMPLDVLPLWVADMDFRTADEIIDALESKAKHGIFGYSEPLDGFYDAVREWFSSHYHFTPKDNKIILVPGIVFGICNIIQALTEEGDSILINQPVYYPFSSAIKDNNRKLIVSNLKYDKDKYQIDFEDLEEKIKENHVKIYLLCNPHNPVGRVWKREELLKIKEITNKYNVLVISDEIHADFIYKNYSFTSYATIDIANAIICNSSSKTFNLAGLHTGTLYVENDSLRRKIRLEINKTGYSQSNVMGIVATEAAYKYGLEWHKEVLEYLEGNLSFVRDFVKKNLDGVKLVEPEGTYLLWLDFNALNMSDDKLNDIIINKAKLWLDSGNIFGKEGIGFERINIACPRAILKEALERLKAALYD